MAKDGTNRGGFRVGAGRKPKAITEKIESGNPGGRPLTVVSLDSQASELQGEDMPPVREYMKSKQKDGSVLYAEEIYNETWEWLKKYSLRRSNFRIRLPDEKGERFSGDFALCDDEPRISQASESVVLPNLSGNQGK